MKLVKTPFIGLLALVHSVIGATLPTLQSRTSCGDSSQTIILRRDYNPTTHDHAMTGNGWDEVAWIVEDGYSVDGDPNTQGWTSQAGSFFSGNSPQPLGTFPFYRLYNNVTITHLYTTSPQDVSAALNANPPFAYESGTTAGVGITGFVYVSNACPGTVPLYWLYNAAWTDNYYTVLESSVTSALANGYVQNGIAAYIYPPT